jgi:serine/threonine protein kinase
MITKGTNDCYTLTETNIGNGMTSTIRVAIGIKTGQKLAAKIYDANDSETNQQLAEFETSILYKLSGCKNIIKLIDYSPRDHIPFLELGDENLCTFVEQKQFLPEMEAKLLFLQMLEAVKYCHKKQIYHHDIKLENFVLIKKKAFFEVKLLDFGLAVDMSLKQTCSSSSSRKKTKKNCDSFGGSPLYTSPQVLLYQPHDAEKNDVFGLGVCFYVMLFGRFPFCEESCDNIEKLCDNIMTQELSFQGKRISRTAKTLLSSLLSIEETSRPSISQILQHPYFTQFSSA